MPTIASENPRDRIIIADKDKMICELLHLKFSEEDFDVDMVDDARNVLLLNPAEACLILVDMMDAEFTGLDLTRTLKRNPSTMGVPIIIISKQRSVDDVVKALNVGVDDFVAKPFSARELIARVRSVMRRRRITAGRRLNSVFTYRDLKVDVSTGMVTIDGDPIKLTRIEFLILALLMRDRNQFFDRQHIRHEAWEDDGSVSDRVVDTNISRLRKKIGVYGRNIINRHGYGYGFVE